MSTYKLYYFNVSGLAEPIRYLFHYCGVEFEDVRIDDFKNWTTNYKSQMPMEQAPVLEIDGVKYNQHKAIFIYLARKFGLRNGETDEQTLKMDAFLDDINDIRLDISYYFKEQSLARKEKMLEELAVKLNFYLKKFEKQVKRNNGYFFNNKLTYVDIYYAGIIEIMEYILKTDLNEQYPYLQRNVKTVRNLERIKAYLDTRPPATR